MDRQRRQRRAGRVQRLFQPRALVLHALAGFRAGGVEADVQLVAGQHHARRHLAQRAEAQRQAALPGAGAILVPGAAIGAVPAGLALHFPAHLLAGP
jgi:hypothetical protein